MFDIHCHVLHNVDDGSRTLRESVAMLREAHASGIDRVVCTPHCRWDDFDYQRVVRHFETLAPHAAEIGIELNLGFEVYWEKLSELGMDRAPSLRIRNTDLMLLEFSSAQLPAQWRRIVYELQTRGIQPVIAHPERYRPIQKDLDIAFEMNEMGCLLQLSANFIEGGFGSARKKTATELLRHGLADYLASDAHRVQDYERYRKALAYAQKF